jgi:hypothetical protein
VQFEGCVVKEVGESSRPYEVKVNLPLTTKSEQSSEICQSSDESFLSDSDKIWHP